jgi:AbrB family looped-hinge helix DNA binding protein
MPALETDAIPKPILTDATHCRKIGNALYIPIPKRIRTRLKWGDGDLLLICTENNRVLLDPISPKPKGYVDAFQTER